MIKSQLLFVVKVPIIQAPAFGVVPVLKPLNP